MLVSRQEQAMTDDELDLPDDEIDALVLKRADVAFAESCVRPLDQIGYNLPYAKVSGSNDSLSSSLYVLHLIRQYFIVEPQHRNMLSNLINVTQDLVSRHVEGDVWIISAMAQRASAQAKIDSSIECAVHPVVLFLKPIY